MSDWSPTSWQTKPAKQQASYPDADAAARVVEELSRLPPLVTSWEVEALKEKLALAGRGQAFVLQGGDCAESFDDCDSSAIASKLKILLQMSLVLVHATKRPVINIGRIAGQYAKPRSTDNESRDGVVLPAYRGDLVNRSGFTRDERVADPQLMLRGYERAAATLNFIRALAEGGFADLTHPEYWDLDFVKHSSLASEYERIVAEIRSSVEFMEAMTGHRIHASRRVDFYTSHEGLVLFYEQAQTRTVPRRTGWYDLSTHLPWIGMRTADIDGAHVEYFRGIENPVGVKVGPTMSPELLIELTSVLNPSNEPGRMVLIHRMGAKAIETALPPLIDAVTRTRRVVTWLSDPMHGNTETTADGIKTRRFENIISELEQAFAIHQRMGTIMAGTHFEMTGDNVTECIGGARNLSAEDLKRAYRSRVDPRLNYEQALEMAMSIARHLRR